MKGQGTMAMLLGAVLLAAAAVLFAITTWAALRPPDGPSGEAASLPAETETEVTGLRNRDSAPPEDAAAAGGEDRAGADVYGILYPRVSDEELLEAVNHDVFMPRRTPPLERYVLPGQRIGSRPEEAEAQRREPGPGIRVVGSAFSGGAALALVQVNDSIPLAILLGEEVGGYILTAVDEESATLVGDSETLTLPVVPPSSWASSTAVGPQGATPDAQSLQALQERVQQMLRAQLMNARRQNPNRGGRGGGGQP